MFFKKKEELLLSTSREFGKWENNTCIIGAAHGVYKLPEEQSLVWELLKKSMTLKEWENNIQNIKDFNEKFEDVCSYFENRYLLVKISDYDVRKLSEFRVTRNGMGIGNYDGEFWLVGSYDSEQKINMKREQYLVWACADGTTSIPKVIENIKSILKCSSKRAFNLFKENVKVFIQKGLWSIEYQEVIGIPHKTFLEELKINSTLLPIGQEIGVLNDSGNYYLTINGDLIELSSDEYVIWTMVKQNAVNTMDLSEVIERDEEEIFYKFVKPMVQRGLLTVWTSEKVRLDSSIRINPVGLSIVGMREKIKMMTCTIGKVQELPFLTYLLWSKATPNITLSQLKMMYQEEAGCTDEDALLAIYQFVPFLVYCGLMTLVERTEG